MVVLVAVGGDVDDVVSLEELSHAMHTRTNTELTLLCCCHVTNKPILKICQKGQGRAHG